MNSQDDRYIEKQTKWRDAFLVLREIILETNLTEELKWGKPCYTYGGKNIAIVQDFKNYCALMFVKGVLLSDPKNQLFQLSENTQSARQFRWENVQDVQKMKGTIQEYLYEAIEIEKQGLKVEMKKTSEYEVPEELKQAMAENPELKSAFFKLTPGRQRGYLLYFSQAKQSKTRKSRIEKSWTRIKEGKGYNER